MHWHDSQPVYMGSIRDDNVPSEMHTDLCSALGEPHTVQPQADLYASETTLRVAKTSPVLQVEEASITMHYTSRFSEPTQ